VLCFSFGVFLKLYPNPVLLSSYWRRGLEKSTGIFIVLGVEKTSLFGKANIV